MSKATSSSVPARPRSTPAGRRLLAGPDGARRDAARRGRRPPGRCRRRPSSRAAAPSPAHRLGRPRVAERPLHPGPERAGPSPKRGPPVRPGAPAPGGGRRSPGCRSRSSGGRSQPGGCHSRSRCVAVPGRHRRRRRSARPPEAASGPVATQLRLARAASLPSPGSRSRGAAHRCTRPLVRCGALSVRVARSPPAHRARALLPAGGRRTDNAQPGHDVPAHLGPQLAEDRAGPAAAAASPTPSTRRRRAAPPR